MLLWHGLSCWPDVQGIVLTHASYGAHVLGLNLDNLEQANMNRKEMIDRLVRDSVDTALNPESQGIMDDSWLTDIFTIGFKGFNDYTNDELREELQNRDIDE